jgi:hypothetical protein
MIAAPIVRFCFVRLREEAIPEREAIAHALTAELSIVCAPHLLWVGLPGDESAARWDLSLTIGLPDLAAWQALAASAAFDEAMVRLAAQAEVVKAWTFAAPPAGPASR